MKELNDYNLDEATDVMNFNREVVNYVNDNIKFVREYELEPNSQTFVEHYNNNADALNEPQLTNDAEKQFRFVADQLFEKGYFPRAGVFIDYEGEIQ